VCCSVLQCVAVSCRLQEGMRCVPHVTVYAYVYRCVLVFLRFGVLIYRAVAVKSWRCAKKVADDPSVPLDFTLSLETK